MLDRSASFWMEQLQTTFDLGTSNFPRNQVPMKESSRKLWNPIIDQDRESKYRRPKGTAERYAYRKELLLE